MRLKLFTILILLLCLQVNVLKAQKIYQTLRGVVKDSDSKFPLIGATVVLLSDTSQLKGVSADVNGEFALPNVEVGRHKLKISMIGYQDNIMSDIIVTSAKEVVLEVLLVEKLTELSAIVIEADDNTETLNEMVTVSGRTFVAHDTEKYAGSRQDPARMASNFAGVQGADDSRNDIVVRGNTPIGLLWRFEDVDIPNPNHFAIAGSSGGPISVLNNKVIGTSDFITGAFPAEYGNAISGVFDLKMRNGNNQKSEMSAQIGLFGTELMAEVPIKKGKSSFLATYRYSTLKLFEAVNFNLGTTAIPNYQDWSMKLNFNLKNNASFSVFSIGGLSSINIIMSKFENPQDEIYGERDKDQYFTTNMGVLGASYKKSINKNTFFKSTIATTYSKILSHDDLIYRELGTYKVDSLVNKMDYTFKESKVVASTQLIKKYSPKLSVVYGANADVFMYNYIDSILREKLNYWELRQNAKGVTFLGRGYTQLKYKFSEKVDFSAGLHGLYFAQSNSYAIEPRLGLKVRTSSKSNLALGYGMHHQTQILYSYFQNIRLANGTPAQLNTKMGLTQSQHFIASYDILPLKNLRIKTEIYYQYLSKIPVSLKSPSFSMVNVGGGFFKYSPDTTLVNTGTGRNYGIELTVEKFFSKNYFVLVTGSLFDSKYKGSDHKLRNTDFNGRFALNILSGYEKPVGNGNNKIISGFKVTWAGGRRYSPVDTVQSNLLGELRILESERNTLQFKNYFRTDLKLGYKINAKKFTHEIALDFLNVFNTKNILKLEYDKERLLVDPNANPLRQVPQLGFLPVFYYRLDF